MKEELYITNALKTNGYPLAVIENTSERGKKFLSGEPFTKVEMHCLGHEANENSDIHLQVGRFSKLVGFHSQRTGKIDAH